MTAHALYRMFDADGTLLYIGRTMNPGRRWTAHSNAQPWWASVATVTIAQYPSREAVLDAERAAISDEKPLHNRTARSGARSVRRDPAEHDRRAVPRVWVGNRIVMADRDAEEYEASMRTRTDWHGARGGKTPPRERRVSRPEY